MALPNILNQTRTRVDDDGFAGWDKAQFDGPAAAPGSRPRAGVIRSFEDFAQRQILDMWCWSAVGCSVADYYLAHGGNTLRSQCSNASLHLGASGCCQLRVPGSSDITSFTPLIRGGRGTPHSPGRIPCNKGEWPEKITTAAGLVSDWSWHDADSGPRSDEIERIIDSILAGHPVVKYIDWKDGSAHVVTIYGVHEGHDGLPYFHIADPLGVLDILPLGAGNGVWRGSMTTRFQAGPGDL